MGKVRAARLREPKPRGANASCWAHIHGSASPSLVRRRGHTRVVLGTPFHGCLREPEPTPDRARAESPRSAAAFRVFGPRPRHFGPMSRRPPPRASTPSAPLGLAPKRAQRLVCGHGQSVARSGGSPRAPGVGRRCWGAPDPAEDERGLPVPLMT